MVPYKTAHYLHKASGLRLEKLIQMSLVLQVVILLLAAGEYISQTVLRFMLYVYIRNLKIIL